jgi:hypothetical protein
MMFETLTETFDPDRQLPEKKAFLFVNGLQVPFSTMRYTPALAQYDNKIIECSWLNNQWQFHRQRTDKSFPNAKGMYSLADQIMCIIR